VQSTVPATGLPLAPGAVKAPKNGYVYVYLSNRSDQDVYFDDFKVTITTGSIIEENHYYAFGLKVAALSSKKLGDNNEGTLPNNYQYQGAFSEMDADIGWNDFPLRNYDAQTGRFVEQDPFGQFASPYLGMGNDPVNMIDPSGGIGIPCPGTSQLAIFFMKAGETIGKGLDALSHVTPLLNIASNAARTGVDIFNHNVQFQIVGRQLLANSTPQVGAKNSGTNSPGVGSSSGDDGDDLENGPKAVLYLVFEQLTPETYRHIRDVTDPNAPNRKPLLLTYDGNAERKDKRRSRNLGNSGLEQLSDPWRDDYPFVCTYEGDDADVRYAPKWEQIIQRGEIRSVTARLKDGDKILVVLIPKGAPPPVVSPRISPKSINDVKNNPSNWNPRVDWKPWGALGAGVGATYLIDAYGGYLLMLLLL
jgi:RHS repeat-associated protein